MTVTLLDFMREKKRAGCAICALPDAVRAQLLSARDKKIRRADQIEWLRSVIGAEITHRDLDSHYAGRHDEP
jgi:hypothetical protein